MRDENAQDGSVFGLLDPRLQHAIRGLGYKRPTLAQEKAIPAILRGSHVLIIAPTGSGKTEAALFPIMSRLLEKPSRLGAIYITPLRSLNRDIFERMAKIAESVGLELRVRHGDTSSYEKREFLRSPPHIMVTTPETLYFLLSVDKFRDSLRGLRFIVVDELHEMIDSKRGAELAVALERVEHYSGGRVQRIGLSATLSNPMLAARMLAGDRIVEIIDLSYLAKKMTILVDTPQPSKSDEELARKLGVEATVYARLNRIKELVEETRGGVIIFTNTRDSAEVLGALLKKVLGEGRILVHHGSLSREERVKAEKYFREGKIKAIVATSSLELGIDIGHADLVIQYMSPRQARRLVQRVGRSRHRLGEVSRGIIIASTNFYDILESAVIAARALRGNLEKEEPYDKPYDALVHQLAGMLLEKGSISLRDAYWLFRRAEPYKELGYDELLSIVSYMDMVRIARLEGERLRKGRRLYSYYYEVTMIPDTRQYPVYDTVSGKKIGVLDEEFVATLSDGDIFVLAGRVWEVVTVEENAVRVKPAEGHELIPPAWEGELIPVEYGVAREAGSILRRYEALREKVLEDYPLTARAKRLLTDIIEKHIAGGYPLPTDKRIVVEALGDTVVVHAFLGSRAAKALELALSYSIKEVTGYTPWSTSMPYAVVMKFSSRVPVNLIESTLKRLASLSVEELRDLVYTAAKATKLYEWKLYHVALRMGAIEKDAKLDRRMLRRLADTIVGLEALKELAHDKLDIDSLHNFLRELASGHVELVAFEQPPGRISPLAEQVLSEARMGDRVMAEALPATLLAEVVKRRIAGRRVRLICLMCGEVWESTIGELPDKPRCPRCGAAFIAPTRLSPEEARELVLKMRRRVKLKQEEAKVAKELKDAADVVLTYGRKGVEALTAIGVGPSTARQVLRRLVFGEEAFYKALVEAEQKYLRTRRYWS
ncbi:MAG: DEAD/DEAH box helicase [Pyrodictiaceae archaeon]